MSSSRQKRKPVDINDWDPCVECGVEGPDVKIGEKSRYDVKCASCRGEKLPERKSQQSFWDARHVYQETWTRIKEAKQAIVDAKEELEDAEADLDKACRKVIKEQEKLSGGKVWGIDYKK